MGDERAGFDLYETRQGLVSVEHPAKRLILERMGGHELEPSQIVELVGLGKSTVSTHLGNLADEGLVAHREHPGDRRRKLYFLTAKHVATSCESQWDLVAALRTQVGPALGDPLAFHRLLLRSLKMGIDASGLNLDPVLKEMGRAIGEELGRRLRTPGASTLADLREPLARVWHGTGLGNLELRPGDAETVRIANCQLCTGLERLDRGLCPLSEGLLEGAINEALATASRVAEVRRDAGKNCACAYTVEI